jgi:hypothetical protein
VSLAKGGFTAESKLHVDGAQAVLKDASTQFDDVLTAGDGDGKNKARMRFQYALLDNDQPVLSKDNGQPLYVFGSVSNRSTWDRFTGESSCHLITLDDHIETNPDYTCTMSGAYAGSVLTAERAQYIADFTVSKKSGTPAER